MPTDRELLQQALDALMVETDGWDLPRKQTREAIEALRARLAQPEPEPVAWITTWNEKENAGVELHWTKLDKGTTAKHTPLYTTPPQREWQGLTDEEVKAVWSELWYDLGNGKFAASDATSRHTAVMFANAIESKLKEKTMTEGKKYDQGKPRWSLIPSDVMGQVVNVLEHGAAKYGEENWKNVSQAQIRYYDAAMRHIDAWWHAEQIDKESGQHHLAHAICCLMFLMWFDKHNNLIEFPMDFMGVEFP